MSESLYQELNSNSSGPLKNPDYQKFETSQNNTELNNEKSGIKVQVTVTNQQRQEDNQQRQGDEEEEQQQNNQNQQNIIRYDKKTVLKIMLWVLLVISLLVAFAWFLNYLSNSIEPNKEKKEEKEVDYLCLKGKNNCKDIVYQNTSGGYITFLTPYTYDYYGVSGLIKLTDSLETFRLRNAYIVFGVECQKCKFNIGLINAGDGWKPFYQIMDESLYMKVYKEYYSEENKYIRLQIEVKEREILVCCIFYNSNKKKLRKLNFEIDISGFLEEGEKIRFYRTISLDPLGEDNRDDKTFLKDVTISDLKIFKNESWGKNSNNINTSFIVHPKNVKFDHSEDEEVYSIIHQMDDL